MCYKMLKSYISPIKGNVYVEASYAYDTDLIVFCYKVNEEISQPVLKNSIEIIFSIF